MNYNKKIYLIAMKEALINNSFSTCLGDYSLEYKFLYTNLYNLNFKNNNACLALLVRLKNNVTNNLEWANVYYKVLVKNGSIHNYNTLKNAKNSFEKIENGSYYEKLKFIYKKENVLNNKMYLFSNVVFVGSDAFLKDVNGVSFAQVNNFDLMLLITKKAKLEINDYFKILNSVNLNNENKYKQKNKKR